MGKKENLSAHKTELKRCFSKIVFSQIFLSQENYDKQGLKLHYIPGKFWFHHGLLAG